MKLRQRLGSGVDAVCIINSVLSCPAMTPFRFESGGWHFYVSIVEIEKEQTQE